MKHATIFIPTVMLISTLFVSVSGCATKPESIAPAYVSEMSYSSWTCKQLGEEQSRLVSALATASDAQRTARSNDIAGVILIGLPVSSLSGSNQAAQIARLKGELDAVQKTGIKKDCNLPKIEDPTSKKKDENKESNPVH